MKKDQSKTTKPAAKGKVKDLPTRKLTSQQEGSVKGGGTRDPGGNFISGGGSNPLGGRG